MKSNCSKKILIIGAGPAGLASAYELYKDTNSCLVTIVEASNQVGGISKTINLNGYLYDIGSHRFYSKISEVNQLWNEVLGNHFLTIQRQTRILYQGKLYDYPLQVKNALLNLGFMESLIIILSYFKSKLIPKTPEQSFEDWVTNRFGKRLYTHFFKTYTEKVWGIPCSKIQAEWAAQRIKNLSLISAAKRAIFPSKKGESIKSLISEFKYPRLGAGMMYEQMATTLNADIRFKLILNTPITELTYKNDKWVTTINNKKMVFDEVVSTMPINQLISIIKHPLVNSIKNAASMLSFRSLITVNVVLNSPPIIRDNWIYVHDNSVKMGRFAILNNWSTHLVKNKKYSSVCIEYFCTKNDDQWQKNDGELIQLAINELKRLKIIPSHAKKVQAAVLRTEHAYPVYDSNYANNLPKIKVHIKALPQLQVAGRGGMFKYNNMDHSIYTGILAARNILLNKKKYDLWQINTDDEYHEEESYNSSSNNNNNSKKEGK